jgi:hypothetical protein
MKRIILVIGMFFIANYTSAQIQVACIGNSITAGKYFQHSQWAVEHYRKILE